MEKQVFLSSQINEYQQDFVIKNASQEQFRVFVDWAEQQGWHPGLNDAKLYYVTDPSGFFIGYLREQAIACISTLRFDQNNGFIGFFIVKPQYRKQGFGLKIFKHALKFMQNRNVGLDGVLQQVHNYQKSGFQKSHLVSCYTFHGINQNYTNQNIVPLRQIPLQVVRQYESNCILQYNEQFTRQWINKTQFSFGYLLQGKLRGFCVMRKTKKFHKIAPLLADSPLIADSLISKMRSYIAKEQKIIISVWTPNKDAVNILQKYKGQVLFSCMRMYTKNIPKQLKSQKIYGIYGCQIG